MDKPLTIIKYEFEQDIEKLINNGIKQGLPSFTILQVFQSATEAVQNFYNQQLKKDIEEYESSIRKEEEK